MSSMPFGAVAQGMSGELLGDLRIGAEGEITGYVLNALDLERRFVVELRLDGEPIAVAVANRFEPALITRSLGDGCYGFRFATPQIGESAGRATVVLANSDHQVGSSFLIQSQPRDPNPDDRPSHVRWFGGLRFAGWLKPQQSENAEEIEVVVEGECVARTTADRWTPFGDRSLHGAAQFFDIVLPRRFADGRVRKAHLRLANGFELEGSPIAFVAFEDGLADFLQKACVAPSEDLRGGLYEKLMPQSIPFHEFGAWRERYPQSPLPTQPLGRVAVALIGERRLDESLISLDAQKGCEWVAGSLTDCGAGVAFEPDELELFLTTEAEGCDVVILAKSGTVFETHALAHLFSALELCPQASTAYPDLIMRGADGSVWPLAWPAFDYERVMEQGYAARVFAVRNARLRRAVAMGARDLFCVFNHCLNRLDSDQSDKVVGAPVHLPEFLATIAADDMIGESTWLAAAAREHFDARGLKVHVAASPRAGWSAVRVRRSISNAAVSVVVDARSLRSEMEYCLASLKNAAVGVECEVFIVGNISDLAEHEGLDASAHRVQLRGRASLERCANAVMTAVSGDYLFLLEPAFGDLSKDDLFELMSRMEEPDAAAVGPLRLDANFGIFGASQVLGIGFAAATCIDGFPPRLAAYRDDLAVASEASALVAAGMMTRRNLFRDLNGFDVDRFGEFAASDYGLRAREKGLRLIATPHACLSRVFNAPRRVLPRTGESRERDLRHLRARWGDILLDDPYYNPNLALDRPFCGLAWPPRSRRPRRPARRPPCATPPGF